MRRLSSQAATLRLRISAIVTATAPSLKPSKPSTNGANRIVGSHELHTFDAIMNCSASDSQKRLNTTSREESNPHMKMKLPLSLLAAASLALSSAAFAAGAKTYEVTGPVLDVNDSMIAVQKGKDRWEINRDANTKVTGDLKVGEKVTVTYIMSASDVEVKAGKGAKKEAAKPAAAPTQ